MRYLPSDDGFTEIEGPQSLSHGKRKFRGLVSLLQPYALAARPLHMCTYYTDTLLYAYTSVLAFRSGVSYGDHHRHDADHSPPFTPALIPGWL